MFGFSAGVLDDSKRGLEDTNIFPLSRFVFLQAVQHGCEFTICLKPVKEGVSLAASRLMQFKGALLDLPFCGANFYLNHDRQVIAAV
jgi:hypothetical protein